MVAPFPKPELPFAAVGSKDPPAIGRGLEPGQTAYSEIEPQPQSLENGCFFPAEIAGGAFLDTKRHGQNHPQVVDGSGRVNKLPAGCDPATILGGTEVQRSVILSAPFPRSESPLPGTVPKTSGSSRAGDPPLQATRAESQPELDRFEHGLVIRKAKQMIGRAGLTRDDLEDLRQELLAKVVESLRSFDPQRGHWRAYLVAVVERHVANVIRDRRAAKRSCRSVRSLDTASRSNNRLALVHFLEDRVRTAHCGYSPRTEVDRWELTEDVAAALPLLPDELRNLAEQLKTKSIDQIAEEWSVPRTTLNDRVRKLRQRFEQEQFHKYL